MKQYKKKQYVLKRDRLVNFMQEITELIKLHEEGDIDSEEYSMRRSNLTDNLRDYEKTSMVNWYLMFKGTELVKDYEETRFYDKTTAKDVLIGTESCKVLSNGDIEAVIYE